MTLQISTTGYTSIQVSYWRLFDRSGSSGDQFTIEWRVGTGSWTQLEQLTSDMSSWSQSSTFNLVGADNQGTIQIRFSLSNCESDLGYIDDVLVTGLS